jgi:protein-L-isoaspartate(D-aspartate) O-methyltransferase
MRRSSRSGRDAPDDFEVKRRMLFREIAAEAADSARWTGMPVFEGRIMDAMARVPRHEFVPPEAVPYAWLDQALPIGHRQTISQPFIVALMTNLLDPGPDQVVLEIGTGSGYQAAVLSGLVRKVYSIELDPDLAAESAARLARLGYDNVEVRSGDGAEGWPEHAPFDGIIVTAGAPDVPPRLVEQLREGGRLVIPVDSDFGQDLRLLRKKAGGMIETRSVLPVAFVPLRKPSGDSAR